MANIKGVLLALDVGEKRTGVAIANLDSGLARPLQTLENPEAFYDEVAALIISEDINGLIIGLPLNINGEDTAQTAFVRQFASDLSKRINTPINFQDEADTSQKAERELKTRKKNYTKADIDGLAATYILQAYIDDQLGVRA